MFSSARGSDGSGSTPDSGAAVDCPPACSLLLFSLACNAAMPGSQSNAGVLERTSL